MSRLNIFLVLVGIVFSSSTSWSQDDQEEALLAESQELRADASVAISKDEFYQGEAKYRKAIALQPKDATVKYNLGNAYYNKNKNEEAMKRFLQAGEIATTKQEKHVAFHNLGNTLMNAKMYAEAVEAYKNALRNNPTDDETRYNLALAKEMLEKEEQNNGGGENDKDQDQEDKKDKEEENKDQNQGDDGDQKEEENKDGEKDQEEQGDQQNNQGDPDKPEEQKQEQQKPKEGQLSPQQIESILEAMNNEEKKVQQKMNARKAKGAKKKSSKDW